MNLVETIQYNCDISDARDQGIYSMCTMVLKLRNLYKWEHGLEPWNEPEPADLLDWIEQKENHWAAIDQKSFKPVVSARIAMIAGTAGILPVYGDARNKGCKALNFESGSFPTWWAVYNRVRLHR